jgi:hypothetical protein
MRVEAASRGLSSLVDSYEISDGHIDPLTSPRRADVATRLFCGGARHQIGGWPSGPGQSASLLIVAGFRLTMTVATEADVSVIGAVLV